MSWSQLWSVLARYSGFLVVLHLCMAAVAFNIALWATVGELAGLLGFICLFVSAAPLMMFGLVLLKEKRTEEGCS